MLESTLMPYDEKILKPANMPYHPFGAARDLFYCRDIEILLDGPAGTGKTRGILEKIVLCLLKYPGARGLICRKTRASMTESVLSTLERVIPDNPKLYPQTKDILRRVRQNYEFPNGSTLIVAGLDNIDRIMSTDYDIVGVFEATEILEKEWEMLLTRIGRTGGLMPYAQAIADCNPSAPNHWLNKRADRCMKRLLSRHEDNPLWFDHKTNMWTQQGKVYIDQILSRLSGARLQRLKFGRWVAAEGVVYEGYDAAIHLIDKMPEGWIHWRKIRSIDFGFSNPFVCQWWAIDNDGRMYLYRQIYFSNVLVEDHARQIMQLTGAEIIEDTLCDHDLEDRMTLEKYGVLTSPAYKPIEIGIQGVASRLRPAGDGKPRLFIVRDSLVEVDQALKDKALPTSTQEEFDAYLRPTPKDHQNIKELPVDKDNHGMDTLRYAVAYLDDLAFQQFEVTGGSMTGVDVLSQEG
jgi:phage terminase large subunit